MSIENCEKCESLDYNPNPMGHKNCAFTGNFIKNSLTISNSCPFNVGVVELQIVEEGKAIACRFVSSALLIDYLPATDAKTVCLKDGRLYFVSTPAGKRLKIKAKHGRLYVDDVSHLISSPGNA